MDVVPRTGTAFLNTIAGTNPGFGLKSGYPISSVWSYKFDGLNDRGDMTFWSAPDDRSYVSGDIGGRSSDALVYSGSAVPINTFSLENHVTWNGFSLSVMMVYYGGHYMHARQHGIYFGPGIAPMPDWLGNAWTPEHTNTTVPGWGQYNPTNNMSGVWDRADIFVRPADFLKIRNIVLGYDLPREWISKVNINALQLRFQIDNLPTIWTKNDVGVDPETIHFATNSTTQTRGVRLPTSFIFGLNLRF